MSKLTKRSRSASRLPKVSADVWRLHTALSCEHPMPSVEDQNADLREKNQILSQQVDEALHALTDRVNLEVHLARLQGVIGQAEGLAKRLIQIGKEIDRATKGWKRK